MDKLKPKLRVLEIHDPETAIGPFLIWELIESVRVCQIFKEFLRDNSGEIGQ
jgi:hypothetical protein